MSKAQVKTAKVYTTSAVELITPKIAREILSKNTNNRSLNNRTVEYYQDQIKRGLWELNGETIKIAIDGTLLDGQHRLEAVSRSGISIETFVARNIPNNAFTTIDTGKVRTHADFLKINGTKGNLSQIAAAARIAMGFQKDGLYLGVDKKVAPDDIVGYVDRHQRIIISAEAVGERIGKILPASIGVGLHYIFTIIDEEKTNVFFDHLISGADLTEGNAILTLRNRLLSMRGNNHAGASHRRLLVYSVVHAFNAFMKGRKIMTLPYQTEYTIKLDGFKESCLTNWK